MSNFFIFRNAYVTRASCSGVAVSNMSFMGGWYDLPREPVLVLQPPALLRGGNSGELLPIAVDLRLRLARHHERDRLVEFEDGPAVIAMNGWPFSSKATTSQSPEGVSRSVVTLLIFEFGKTEQ
jgi:hypothetical protein